MTISSVFHPLISSHCSTEVRMRFILSDRSFLIIIKIWWQIHAKCLVHCLVNSYFSLSQSSLFIFLIFQEGFFLRQQHRRISWCKGKQNLKDLILAGKMLIFIYSILQYISFLYQSHFPTYKTFWSKKKWWDRVLWGTSKIWYFRFVRCSLITIILFVFYLSCVLGYTCATEFMERLDANLCS